MKLLFKKPLGTVGKNGNYPKISGQAGLTLIELLIYSMIFTVAAGLMTGILIAISGIQTRENSAFEISRQLQFVTQRMQYVIRDASVIEGVYEGDTEGTACTAYCSIKLRVEDPALDPTIISSNAGGVYLKEGTGQKVALTNPNVRITSLLFTKVGNPGGLSTVTINLAIIYNPDDPKFMVAKTLTSAIAHVSAATFDSDLLPDATESRNIGGTSLKWNNLILSGGITITGPDSIGEQVGVSIARGLAHGSSGISQYYVTSTPYDKYGQRFDIGGTPMLYLEGDIGQTGRRAYILNGNVGIGTASPTSIFEVYGGSDTSQIIWAENIRNNGNALLTGYGAGLKLKISSDSVGNEINKWAGVAAIAGTEWSNRTDMVFYVNPTSSTAPVEKMRLTGDGNLGIGSTPSYKLDVAGDLRITGTPYRNGGDIAWAVPSDARIKDVTGSFNYGVSDINKLNIVKFRYKEGNELGIDSTKEYAGLIAQEVQKIMPEAVFENKGYLTLNSTPIMWAMLNSIKELSAKVDAQQVIIDQLNKRINKLEGR